MFGAVVDCVYAASTYLAQRNFSAACRSLEEAVKLCEEHRQYAVLPSANAGAAIVDIVRECVMIAAGYEQGESQILKNRLDALDRRTESGERERRRGG